MKKFAEVAHYYLGTGLNAKLSNQGIFNLDLEYPTPRANEVGKLDNIYFLNDGSIEGCLRLNDGYSFDFSELTEITPLMHPLSSLTKPITVEGYNDGKQFVPLDELNKVLGYTEVSIVNFVNSGLGYHINDGAPTALSFRDDVFPILSLLLKWHFNVFDIPETEYIKID